MPSPYDSLRAELDAAQRTRDQLMKWKAIAVTTVGAAALGFSEASPRGAYLALAVIPFACAYIDLLCRNLSVRTKRVSRFLSEETDEDPIVRFEKFYTKRKVKSALESIALVGSSLLLSVAIIPLGIAIAAAHRATTGAEAWPDGLFWGAGALGVVMATVVEILYRLRKAELGAA